MPPNCTSYRPSTPPRICRSLNVLLFAMLLLAGVLFWTFGVCVSAAVNLCPLPACVSPRHHHNHRPCMRAGIGLNAQSDAVDAFGRPMLRAALSSSLIVSFVFFALTCCGGGIMRVVVTPDAPFMDVPVMGEGMGMESTPATGADAKGRRNGCVRMWSSLWWCLRQLGP